MGDYVNTGWSTYQKSQKRKSKIGITFVAILIILFVMIGPGRFYIRHFITQQVDFYEVVMQFYSYDYKIVIDDLGGGSDLVWDDGVIHYDKLPPCSYYGVADYGVVKIQYSSDACQYRVSFRQYDASEYRIIAMLHPVYYDNMTHKWVTDISNLSGESYVECLATHDGQVWFAVMHRSTTQLELAPMTTELYEYSTIITQDETYYKLVDGTVIQNENDIPFLICLTGKSVELTSEFSVEVG